MIPIKNIGDKNVNLALQSNKEFEKEVDKKRDSLKNSIGIVYGHIKNEQEPAFYFKTPNIKIETIFKNIFARLSTEKDNDHDITSFIDPLNGISYVVYHKKLNKIDIHLSLWYALAVRTGDKLTFKEMKELFKTMMSKYLDLKEDVDIDLKENRISNRANEITVIQKTLPTEPIENNTTKLTKVVKKKLKKKLKEKFVNLIKIIFKKQ